MSRPLSSRPPLTITGLALLALAGAVATTAHTAAAAPAELPAPPTRAFADPSGEVMRLWRELREWRPERGSAATVAGLTLTRDAAEIHLEQGTLTLLELRGRTAGAVFEGSGRVRFDVPRDAERLHLLRHLDLDELDVPVERLVLLFADDTADELLSAADFQPSQLSRSAGNAVRDAMQRLVGDDEGTIAEGLVRAFLNEEPTELFRAHLFPRRGDELYYSFDTTDAEEVSIGRKAPRGAGFETLSQFHRRDAYGADGTLVTQHLDWMTRSADAMHYQALLDIQDRNDVRVQAEIMLTPNVPGGSWVATTLFYDLDVDSLLWGDGTPAEYDRSKDDVSVLWLRIPENVAEGSLVTLKAWYGGSLLDQTRDGFDYLRTTSAWLPRFGASESTFDLTFRARREWQVMSVGERVSLEPDPASARNVVSRWVTSAPSSQVTFSVGSFAEHEFPATTTGPVRLHVAEDFHRRFRDVTADAAAITGGSLNILMQADPEVQVHRDIEASLRFFSDVFGPLDFREYNVAEIPGTHGQAFPGMVNLSWQTYVWTSPEGFDEIFRAHEVAHQWWGIGVRPETYHDYWLAEGLAEFSALWYMHKMRSNPARYAARLEDMRERILDRRNDAGPIWLGYRAGVGRDQAEDYQVTIYYKGAWVLHMLRTLLIDNETGSEELFDQLMREVFTRFQNNTISTESFQALAESYLGLDMQWFFDQWVYGTSIPTYEWAYTTEPLPDGNVNLKVRVLQEGVADDFVMPVPIRFEFAQQGEAFATVVVTGPETVADFVLPGEPDEVDFNAAEGVLAEVVRVRW